jgi:hypothetical protein
MSNLRDFHGLEPAAPWFTDPFIHKVAIGMLLYAGGSVILLFALWFTGYIDLCLNVCYQFLYIPTLNLSRFPVGTVSPSEASLII